MHELELSVLRKCTLNERFGVEDASIPPGFPRLAYLHLSNDGLLEERRRWSGISYHITDAARRRPGRLGGGVNDRHPA